VSRGAVTDSWLQWLRLRLRLSAARPADLQQRARRKSPPLLAAAALHLLPPPLLIGEPLLPLLLLLLLLLLLRRLLFPVRRRLCRVLFCRVAASRADSDSAALVSVTPVAPA